MGERPLPTINFITCHDGMTLNDLVTYDHKRNEANGEDGRDGTNDDRSWGCGADGPTDDPDVETLRARQVRNLLALTSLSMGVPMLLMGDEVRRTQLGNNNAYCHDDPTSWFDWSRVERHADVLEYTQGLLRFRTWLRRHLVGHADAALRDIMRSGQITWSGVRYGQPDLSDASHSFAITLHGAAAEAHLAFNAYWEALDFELPPTDRAGGPWRAVLDTTGVGAWLHRDPEAGSIAESPTHVGPRSMVVLARTIQA